jgi:hypothetical protein
MSQHQNEQARDDYQKSMAMARLYLHLLRKKGKEMANDAINSFLKGISESSKSRANEFKQSISIAIKLICSEESGQRRLA